MKEQFGIELQLVVDKFKQKMESIKTSIQNSGKQMKNNLKISPDIKSTPFNKLQADFELSSQKADVLYDEFKRLKEQFDSMPSWKANTEEYQKLSDKVRMAELAFQKAGNKSDELRQKLENLELVSDEVGRSSEKSANRFDKSMGKMATKVKRFALSLFSVRSIYSILSRASQAYQNIDNSTSQKIQSAWAGLGAMLAPVLEKLANLFIKLVGYVNVFVKALTDNDFIATANAKSLDSVAKSAKNATKSLAGFDEIQNLNQETASPTSYNPFDVFKTEDLDGGIVKKLQEMAGWLKENEDLIKDVGIAFGIAFGAKKIKELLSNISNLIGVGGAGGNGLAGLGYMLAIVGTTYLVILASKGIKEVITEVETINRMLDENTRIGSVLYGKTEETSNKFLDLAKSGEITTDELERYNKWLDETIRSGARNIENLEGQKTWYGDLTGANEKLTEQQQIEADKVKLLMGHYHELYETGKMTQKQKEKYAEFIKEDILKLQAEGFEVGRLKERYKEITGQEWNINLKANFEDNASSGISGLVTKLKNNFKKSWGGAVDTFKSIFEFADGGFPAQGQLFLARESGPELVGNVGGRNAVANNNQIVSAVSQGVAEAVSRVMGTGNKQPIIVNVAGKTLYKDTVDYINNQSRIMGRGVI